MTEDKSGLSLRLNNFLIYVGVSEELRRLHRDTATSSEIVYTVESLVSGTLANHYHCGSAYEGTVTPDMVSDKDFLVCHSYTPVVPDLQRAPHRLSLLIVRDSWTYPGYVKLQEMIRRCSLVEEYGLVSHYSSKIDWKGRICCAHFPAEKRHGPAVMFINENGVHVFDYVAAYKCEIIPPYDQQWFLRVRPYGRPSQEQLHQMKRLGCMFVCAGYVYSGEKSIEWRQSFTLQERQLMSELTPVQHKVYVLLKLIKKDILKGFFNDESLTSYHCKTCILFAVQMTPVRAWTEEKLIKCLLQCLKLLIKWIEQDNCPNYFIKDQNLFKREGFSRVVRVRLLRVMQFIMETDANFLYMIQSDSIGEFLRNGRYQEITTIKKNDYVFELNMRTIRNNSQYFLQIIHDVCSGCYDYFSLARVLNVLQRIESINGHSSEVTQSSLAYLYPFFHLHLAIALASHAFKHPEMVDHQSLVQTVNFQARGLDLVNERLARATLLYKSEHYEECFLLLQQIEIDFVKQVAIMCLCTFLCTPTYDDIQDQQEHQGEVAGMTTAEIIQSSIAFCVGFLPSEVEIVPAPLHYEMQRSAGTTPDSRDEKKDFWFDRAVVNPRIYLHFMQYLVTFKLNKEAQKQEAIDNIRALIVGDNRRVIAGRNSHLSHKETAYNLLGWIHMQEGRFAEAFVCFAESWKIRPHHNAAKFHLCNLNTNLTTRQE